ncbi:hypothetical protein D3C85_1410880 [compost metagenome]
MSASDAPGASRSDKCQKTPYGGEWPGHHLYPCAGSCRSVAARCHFLQLFSRCAEPARGGCRACARWRHQSAGAQGGVRDCPRCPGHRGGRTWHRAGGGLNGVDYPGHHQSPPLRHRAGQSLGQWAFRLCLGQAYTVQVQSGAGETCTADVARARTRPRHRW